MIYPYLYADVELRSISLLRIPYTILGVLVALAILFIIKNIFYENIFYKDIFANYETDQIVISIELIPFAIYFGIGLFVRLDRYWLKKDKK
jgi:hypothetical protein